MKSHVRDMMGSDFILILIFMSLFTTKDYWNIRVANEEFDERHLAIIDSTLFIGSFSGCLRMYKPQKGDYKANHLVMELQVGEPIMQVITMGSKVCVLLSRKLQFFNGQLQLIREHNLERNAFNMAVGVIGRKELLCIQSCDAMLMLYETEQLQCTAQLSTEYFPLPGPLVLINDMVVLQNSTFEVEGYKYSNLVASQDKKRVQPDWVTNIGEQAQKMIAKGDQILIIGESMLFVMNSTGIIMQQKRLEFIPASMCLMNEVICISSFSGHLLFFKDLKLSWAAKCDHIWHGLTIVTLDGLNLVCGLNEDGYLSLMYLGSEIAAAQKEIRQEEKVSYQEMSAEYQKIVKEIAKKESGPNQQKTDSIMTLEIVSCGPSRLFVEEAEKYLQIDEMVIQCQISILLNKPQANIILSSLDSAIHLEHSQLVYSQDTNVTAFATFRPPSNRNIKVTASFPGGSVSEIIQLPLTLFCYQIPLNKQAQYKITLQIDPSLRIDKVLSDLPYKESSAQGVTLQLADATVTVLGSKANDKWRIQSDKLEYIGFILAELSARCGNKLQFVDQIPLQDVFNVIDEHFTLKLSMVEYNKLLEMKSLEFRAIEKKLLSRFRETNPLQSSSLDNLLELSFSQLMALMDNAQKCKTALKQAEHSLHAVLYLLICLIQLRFNVRDELHQKLIEIFTVYEVCNNLIKEQEEELYTNINYFLKQQIAPLPLEDTTKLKKIITILIDKISKNQI